MTTHSLRGPTRALRQHVSSAAPQVQNPAPAQIGIGQGGRIISAATASLMKMRYIDTSERPPVGSPRMTEEDLVYDPFSRPLQVDTTAAATIVLSLRRRRR